MEVKDNKNLKPVYDFLMSPDELNMKCVGVISDEQFVFVSQKNITDEIDHYDTVTSIKKEIYKEYDEYDKIDLINSTIRMFGHGTNFIIDLPNKISSNQYEILGWVFDQIEEYNFSTLKEREIGVTIFDSLANSNGFLETKHPKEIYSSLQEFMSTSKECPKKETIIGLRKEDIIHTNNIKTI